MKVGAPARETSRVSASSLSATRCSMRKVEQMWNTESMRWEAARPPDRSAQGYYLYQSWDTERPTPRELSRLYRAEKTFLRLCNASHRVAYGSLPGTRVLEASPPQARRVGIFRNRQLTTNSRPSVAAL